MIAAAGNEFASGILGILIGLVVLVIAVLWIIFPVLVLSKFNDLLKTQRQIHRALLAANDARAEIAKALQWMIDNWRKDQ
jgi:hypothetical protein